ncbi:alpha/beta-hydrolase [Aureobasidium sp. EXF-8845]|nr:alpha/beta-hydrolase [Aureobasidium sp. EXF-8845]KAI4844158.1 alpha/beta-hydrolase [Aureobasidium sp. EXF-8846]
MASTFNANPGIGPSTLLDKLQCLVVLPLLPLTVFQVLVRRFISPPENLSLKADFICSLLRGAQPYLPMSILRDLTTSPESRFPTAKRFANTPDLYEKVSGKDFSGHWICKGCPGKPTPVSKVDLVIYYLHGGAYQIGHPASAIAPFLRIAELADKKGISVAVFALDYSLTPEAKYPTQVNQAKAAYRYLLEDQNIDSSKLAILGDSAGAHLILNLLSVMADDEKSLPKPGIGAFLVAPWIDLRCSKDGSFVRNKDCDYLVRDLLITAGEQVIPRKNDATAAHIINFSLQRPNKKSWADILPSKVWVGIGSNDTLLDDAVAFAERAKADGVNVDLNIDEGKVHDWHIVEDIFDTDNYFATVGELPEGMMKGAATMARAIFSTMSR